MPIQKSEFDNFDAIVRKVFSVSHDEIVKREKEYKRKRRLAKKQRQPKAVAAKRGAR